MTRVHLAGMIAVFVLLPATVLAQTAAPQQPAAAPAAPPQTAAPAPLQVAAPGTPTPQVAGGVTTTPPSAQVPPDAQIPVGTRISLNPSGYDDGGRRDPFVSLIAVKKTEATSTAPVRALTGLASLAVSDVAVKGIVHVGSKYMVTLEGPNHRSYTANPQDRLADGLVKTVDADGVVFEVQVTDAAGRVTAHDVRKMLHTATEDIR
jgi:hypothetical protein